MSPPKRLGRPRRIAITITLDDVYPWHHECYQGILRYAAEHDWQYVIDPYLVGMGEVSDLDDYDGVVGRITEHVAQSAAAHGLPVVNHWANSPAMDLHSVLIDYKAGGVMAGEHLIACGYRRIAYIGHELFRACHQELEGIGKALDARDVQPATVMWCDHAYEADAASMIRFRRQLKELIAGLTPPIGVVVHTSSVACYLAQICKEHNLDVPGDVGIVVQQGDPSTDASSPSLTEVEHDYIQIGYRAAGMLDKLISGEPVHPHRRLVAPEGLIHRDSTDVFLCSDPLVSDAMRYIAEHCRETLMVEDVADAMGVSERTLRRRFDEALGRSIRDQIARMRTNRLKLILTETDKPLAEIGEEFGFSSAGQFSRYFASVVGMTPSAYRRQHRGNK